MKDVNDNQTADLLPTPRPRGRPSTGKALTPAQKQAAYRARLAEKSVTVTINRSDLYSLKLLLSSPDPMLPISDDVIERIKNAVYDAGLR